jgi:hypothetical protein
MQMLVELSWSTYDLLTLQNLKVVRILGTSYLLPKGSSSPIGVSGHSISPTSKPPGDNSPQSWYMLFRPRTVVYPLLAARIALEHQRGPYPRPF